MIVYQIAMILCVCSESVGTAALKDYVDEQNGILLRSGGKAHVHNDDIVGILSYNIFIGIAVATIFGSGFFFDLFWPERRESRGVKLAWKASSVLVSLAALGDALALTVIVAKHNAHISGVDDAMAAFYFKSNGKPNPVYRKNAYCVASTVLLWPGVVASFASTYIMWKSLAHNDVFGARSLRSRTKGEEASVDMASMSTPPHTNNNTSNEPVVPQPARVPAAK